MFKPGQHLTVDEQLLSSKTRCKFTQYMPKKPDKFGIKFWILADLSSKYILNGFPYLGKELTRPLPKGELQGEYVVKTLLSPYFGIGHNCTTDNFFTSTKLAEYLLTKQTTLIGTMKKNKRSLPSIVKEKIELHTTRFFENKGCMLAYYQCKPDTSVVLLSTAHEQALIVRGDLNAKNKSTLVQEYNRTKCGVDSVDQMSKFYSVKYPTRRWPVQVWSNILNMASINSWILYKSMFNFVL